MVLCLRCGEKGAEGYLRLLDSMDRLVAAVCHSCFLWMTEEWP